MFGRQPLSYANVVASLALFVALGGTAAAAVTLDRDSVGSREIRDGAVRSAELRDEGVRIADISPGARNALLGDVRFVETGRLVDFLDTCAGVNVTECPNQVELDLEADSGAPTGEDLREDAEPGRNWLVQAKLEVGGTKGEDSTMNRCGLVDVRSPAHALLLDEAQFDVGAETIALSAVVKKRAGDPTVAIRCTEQPGIDGVPGSADVLHTTFVKMTALEVGAVDESE
jgi:hypothetical protein